MSARIDYYSGPFSLRDDGCVRPCLSIHISERDAETRARHWPAVGIESEKRGAYISLTTDVESGEFTTYLSVDQAEEMRDALSAALTETGEE